MDGTAAPRNNTRRIGALSGRHSPVHRLAIVDAGRLCSCTTEFLSSPKGDITVLRVRGEVDLFTLPILQAAVDRVLDERSDHLVVDLSGMTFCSVRGAVLLVHTATRAAHRNVRYVLTSAPRQVRHIWDRLWDGDAPATDRETADAVAAIRSGRDPRTAADGRSAG